MYIGNGNGKQAQWKSLGIHLQKEYSGVLYDGNGNRGEKEQVIKSVGQHYNGL